MELIAELNPLLRGWGEYYKRAQVRKLFQRLDGWIRRRIWSHRYRRWRNPGWKQLPATKLYGEYELVPVALLNTFSCILASLSLRESCTREIRTCSLGGGRRPARKRASSDPTEISKVGFIPELRTGQTVRKCAGEKDPQALAPHTQNYCSDFGSE